MTTVRLERGDPVWRLVLDHPPANALDLDLARALDAAAARAAALVRLPSFASVKAQLRRRALEDMRAIVERDAEPMLAGWI